MMVGCDEKQDEELINLAQKGDLDAFTILYERYFRTVYNRVRFKIPEQDVEDVTQEVFVAVIKSLENFRGEAKFGTWLRTLVNRKIADYYRSRNTDPNALDADIHDIDHGRIKSITTADSLGLQYDDIVTLHNALKKLPDKYREVILLRFADGFQFNEIAERNGQSLEATKSLFRRSLASLKKVIDGG